MATPGRHDAGEEEEWAGPPDDDPLPGGVITGTPPAACSSGMLVAVCEAKGPVLSSSVNREAASVGLRMRKLSARRAPSIILLVRCPSSSFVSTYLIIPVRLSSFTV